jgi:hypothetical protein
MSRIRTHRIGHFAGWPGAPALRTWFRSGDRAHRRSVPLKRRPGGPDSTPQPSRDSIERSVSPDVVEADARRRYWHWFDVAVTILWVSLLLFIVTYAVVKGETALAELDGLALVATYSLSP